MVRDSRTSGGNGSERNGKEGRGPIPQSSRQREAQRRRRGCRCYKFKGSLGSEGEPVLRSRGREGRLLNSREPKCLHHCGTEWRGQDYVCAGIQEPTFTS